MEYGLPTSVEIDGERHAIRTDFRVILEIFEALRDPDLTENEKAQAVLVMFYLEPEKIANPKEAIKQCFLFIDQGHELPKKKKKSILDWERDFEYIIAPVNRVLGYEARAVPYDKDTNSGGLHWWTFLSAFMEIGGDCTLSQILNIRDKQARGKALTKDEKKWYARNREIITLPTRFSESENALLDEWTGGGKNA